MEIIYQTREEEIEEILDSMAKLEEAIAAQKQAQEECLKNAKRNGYHNYNPEDTGISHTIRTMEAMNARNEEILAELLNS